MNQATPPLKTAYRQQIDNQDKRIYEARQRLMAQSGAMASEVVAVIAQAEGKSRSTIHEAIRRYRRTLPPTDSIDSQPVE